MIYLLDPVDKDMGTTSATTSTITVLNKIAAQSGIIVWMTSGSDYKTIALPTKSVTKKRWWSWITFKIRSAITLSFYSVLLSIIYKFSVLKEFRPTVIPEQNPPAQAKTNVMCNSTCCKGCIKPKLNAIGREICMLMIAMVAVGSFSLAGFATFTICLGLG